MCGKTTEQVTAHLAQSLRQMVKKASETTQNAALDSPTCRVVLVSKLSARVWMQAGDVAHFHYPCLVRARW
jgi:hypothetical protein